MNMTKSRKTNGKKDHKLALTVEMIRQFNNIWAKNSVAEIAEQMNITADQVRYICYKIRQAGYYLERKRTNGKLNLLIHTALKGRKRIVKKA